MNVDVNRLQKLVDRAIGEIKQEKDTAQAAVGDGVFATMDEAVKAAAAAQKKLSFCRMVDREHFVQTIRDTVLAPKTLEEISWDTVEETGIGCYEHKLIKNRLAAEKTPGTEDLTTRASSGDDGLTITEYCPFGVIGAITPTTNPTETVICNGIGAIAGGNTIVFSPHPRAKKVTIKLIRALNRALAAAGAPANLIVTVAEPSIENTNVMMKHPDIRMLVATGGPGIVKLVLSSGKKAIGAGSGNPPVVVDETADLHKAAKDIIDGCSFDNNVPCIAEKEVFAVDSICDRLIGYMRENGAYLLTDPDEIQRLVELTTKENGGPKVEFVGKSAKYILGKLGVAAPVDTRVILMETDRNHHFVTEEMLMPILPVVRVKDADEAIQCAYVAEHGNRHTAMIHSTNVVNMTKMAQLLETTIFVKNGPSYAGIGAGGQGYTTFTIAGPTGEGLTSAKSFCRVRRCTMKEGFHIRAKSQAYFNQNTADS
jgi:propionaldehyde dehydrogenase